MSVTLVGRSSSHFTRTARIFAFELEVDHVFRPVLDMTSVDPKNYADNPLLKVPTLLDEQGALYGTHNICRAFALRSGKASQVTLRGDCIERLVANCEEFVESAMLAEVALITGAQSPKLMASIENSLTYLERHLDDLVRSLPKERCISFVEVTLFCLLEHLPFRKIRSVADWPNLVNYARHFAERDSAARTTYHFDAA